MATPLNWFRRNQKGMLIVFGVLLMAVFGLPSVFFSMTPTGGGNSEMAEQVVKYSDGAFTRGEFRDARSRNAQAYRFCSELARRGSENGHRPTVRLFDLIDTSGSDEQVNGRVMSRVIQKRKAAEMGITVGDGAVLDYLKGLGGDDLNRSDLEQFAFDLFRGNPDFVMLNRQIKEEIAIEQMTNVVFTGLPQAPSLIEGYEDYLRLTKRRTASVVKYLSLIHI